MTPDPLLGDPRNLQNFNRYAYALNNPLKFIDPGGYQEEQAEQPVERFPPLSTSAQVAPPSVVL